MSTASRRRVGGNVFRDLTKAPMVREGRQITGTSKRGKPFSYWRKPFSRAGGQEYPGRRVEKDMRKKMAQQRNLNFQNLSAMWYPKGDPRNRTIHDKIKQYSIATNPGGFYAMKQRFEESGTSKVSTKALTILKATGLGVASYNQWAKSAYGGIPASFTLNDIYLFLHDQIAPQYHEMLGAMQARKDHSGVAAAIIKGEIPLKRVKNESYMNIDPGLPTFHSGY